MILLDTHAFIWLVSDRSQLSRAALSAIESANDAIMISVVSAWEIALLNKKERLSLPLPAPEFIDRAIRHHGFKEIPLSRETILNAVNLPDMHNDPFDRVLIAEAIRHKCSLITKDSKIAAYPGLKTVW